MAGSRWASQAAQDAMLKFAPTKSQLAEQLLNARRTYGETVRSGNNAAIFTQQAVDQALPQVQAAYAKADAGQQANQTLVSQQLAGLTGAAAQPFKAEQANEVSTALAGLLGARASDVGRLQGQKVAARAGAQFGARQARSTLQQAIAQILSKGQQAAGEEGAFAQTEQEKLEHEAEKFEQSEIQSKRSAETSRTNSQESNKTSRENSERSAANKNGKSDLKLLTPDKQAEAASTLRAIEHEARALRQEGVPRGEIYQELTTEGGGKNIVKKDAEGHPILNAKGEKQYEKSPAVAAHDVLLSEAALDSVFGYGRVSRGTLQKLHARGYSLKALGLEGPAPGGSSRQPTGLHSRAHTGG